MYPYQLAYLLTKKFAPMDPASETDLLAQSKGGYDKARDAWLSKRKQNADADKLDIDNAGKEGYKKAPRQEYTAVDRIIMLCENPWSRYVLAILYVVLIVRIKKMIAGDDEKKEQDRVTELMAFLKAYDRERNLP